MILVFLSPIVLWIIWAFQLASEQIQAEKELSLMQTMGGLLSFIVGIAVSMLCVVIFKKYYNFIQDRIKEDVESTFKIKTILSILMCLQLHYDNVRDFMFYNIINVVIFIVIPILLMLCLNFLCVDNDKSLLQVLKGLVIDLLIAFLIVNVMIYIDFNTFMLVLFVVVVTFVIQFINGHLTSNISSTKSTPKRLKKLKEGIFFDKYEDEYGNKHDVSTFSNTFEYDGDTYKVSEFENWDGTYDTEKHND